MAKTTTPNSTKTIKRRPLAEPDTVVKKSIETANTGKIKPKKKAKKRQKLTDQEKEQNQQLKEIRSLMLNMGFARMPHIDGKEFVYDGRTSELDDIFYYENVLVLAEYTIGVPSGHLTKKKVIFDRINEKPVQFIKFLLTHEKFKPFKEAFNKSSLKSYSMNQLQIRIIYASKQSIALEHKNLVDNVSYFDYSVVKYFESISKVIKKSAKFEFFDFLNIEFSKIGENIRSSATSSSEDFFGHILPEEHSSFKDGYKVISFYIDAHSLIKRAFVLRKDGWRSKENVGLYQRMFVAKKIKSMRKYLNEEKRVFINNIIVTLPVDKVKIFDENENELKLDDKGNFKGAAKTQIQPAIIKIQNKANIIGIIDGQHRTYAYHEGDDIYEKTISALRGIQNLLITGILYPKDESADKRLKFEAKLFLEINSNQSGASSQLKQEIEFMMNSFSTTAISKHIISKLNESGPLATLFEEFWFEKSKIKTSSIVSFGLKPLIKLDGNDSLFKIWPNVSKAKLKKSEDYALLSNYKEFCLSEIRNFFIALKTNIEKDDWKMDRNNSNAVLNVTTINGMINCLRLLIQNDKNGNVEYYKDKLKKIKGFKFKDYKSSQYRKMGEDIYNRCFK